MSNNPDHHNYHIRRQVREAILEKLNEGVTFDSQESLAEILTDVVMPVIEEIIETMY